MSYLRTRIAAAIMESCHGIYMDDAVDAADAVIGELGLRRQTMSEFTGANGIKISRYITDWIADA